MEEPPDRPKRPEKKEKKKGGSLGGTLGGTLRKKFTTLMLSPRKESIGDSIERSLSEDPKPTPKVVQTGRPRSLSLSESDPNSALAVSGRSRSDSLDSTASSSEDDSSAESGTSGLTDTEDASDDATAPRARLEREPSNKADRRELNGLLVDEKDGRVHIVGGTLEALLWSVTCSRTDQQSIGADTEHIEAVLYTYPYFTNGPEFFSRLTTLYAESAAKPEIQLRTINVLKKWCENHFLSLCDDGLLERYIGFFNGLRDGPNAKWGASALESVQYRFADKIKSDDLCLEDIGKYRQELVCHRIVEALVKASGLLSTRKLGDKKHRKSFIGAEAVTWVADKLQIPRAQAASLLGECQMRRAGAKAPFADDDSIYTFESTLDMLEKVSSHKKPKLKDIKDGRIASFTDVEPKDLARQLTLLEFKLFRDVPVQELIQQAWTKGAERTPHVQRFVDHFNSVSFWVASEIVSESTVKRRITLIKQFIVIAELLRESHNYNTLMAVISGLNHGAVSRLNQTWAALPKPYVSSLATLMTFTESSGNYRKYRKEVAESPLPLIPYFAIYLRDLTFIEDGNDAYLSDGVINFQKMRMLAKVFQEIARFQAMEYTFPESPEILDWLSKHRTVKEDKELYRISKQWEPSRRASSQRSLTAKLSSRSFDCKGEVVGTSGPVSAPLISVSGPDTIPIHAESISAGSYSMSLSHSGPTSPRSAKRSLNQELRRLALPAASHKRLSLPADVLSKLKEKGAVESPY
eukprot:TRINITY_DN7483_c0_g1_i1.p1 TRINITY_DN7483_c0_g1~~TRINITY_DN7483_c0_g1_i1.p1  ORF type:complete len:750 (+),score=198.76 TRINITY_DN7483_c0_g1_i1:128-2377(+)